MKQKHRILTIALASGLAAAPALAEGPLTLEGGALSSASKMGTVADPVVEAPPMAPVPTMVDWTGGYAGVALGVGRASWDDGSSSDVLGNLFAGYMFDMGDYVIGADLNYAPASVFGDFSTASEELRAAWGLVGRAGVKLGAEGRTLASVGVGPSWVRTRDAGGDGNTAVGVTAGVGVDYMIDDNWMLRSGLSYSRFGSVGANDISVNSVAAHVGAAFRF
ncbi:porin family protein [Rhodobacteraceae bacterium 2376]|uniref:Porin family protein n=1 Tax=Rhabdonatronobacter sediminivivens TaxID=2743469 RepID=A0A7Z0HYY0_9RHOB|nr:outer membrane beta-barrel protein [Rhabdonatronobacter sediminivivens]NYS24873.1 porin family protein [Rhabdonatronobacter sediminivivens]